MSKQRVTASGKTIGGLPFSRGALFHMLRNPIYRGRITHKGAVHQGQHEAMIDQDLFDEVQQQLDYQARRHRSAAAHRAVKAPLTGKLIDDAGEPMTPSFSRGGSGRLYRYYVSASLLRGGTPDTNGIIQRISATAIEKLVEDVVRRWMPHTTCPRQVPLSIRLREDGLLFDVPGDLASDIAANLSDAETIIHSTRQVCRIQVPIALPLRGGKQLIVTGQRTSRLDRRLIAGLRKAHAMVAGNCGLPIVTSAPASRYERDLLRLAFLAPDLQRDILVGHQPPTLTLEMLRNIEVPLCWSQQRKLLGWS